jgi:hypothetical protein
MSFKDKVQGFIDSKKQQIERGRVVTEQMKADRLRKKQNKLEHMKPGARKAISVGLKTRDSPLNVMKIEYLRRRYEREHKAKKNK